MLPTLNHFCSNCLRTRRFLDLRTHLVCESCTKRLERRVPEPVGAQPERVTWAAAKPRRDVI